MSMRRQIAVSTVLAALVGLIASGIVAVGLVRTAYDAQARANLHQQAEVLATAVESGTLRPRLVRRALGVQYIRVLPDGTGAGQRLPGDVVAAAQRGQRLSATRTIGAQRFLVEVAPVPSGGGIVAFQALSEARAVTSHVYRRLLIAAIVGLGIAVLIGVALARRLSTPLIRAAEGAHRLATGERSVRMAEEGPYEVAEVSRSINALAQALSTSEGRERDFLLSVSHELKTPLTGIRGFAEALTEGVVEPSEAGRTIEAEATRMQRLVADLLELARAGADDFRVDIAPTDLVALVVDAETVWSKRCADVGVELRTDLPAACVVSTDGGRVRQVLDGLLENALRVTPAGQPIVVALHDGTLEVRDGGPGLAPEDLPVAFDRSVLYERYKGVRQVGTGLGLALVASLVRRLGGTVEAGHAAEGGARFVVRLR
ncbi:MAG: two-component system, OmpR family, sensor kinase [Frankiales bacterium]|jgi:two-component system OmpR family sensor kinase|nr:two-component system, OmpR family, sensor kinase [Frankiales bacterium]